jgi:hypothetical protein
MCAVAVTVDVQLKHRRALEAMGLILPGNGYNPKAVAWAVARYLDTAPAMQAMGEALYPHWPPDDAQAERDTVSPAKPVQNGE